MWFVGAVFALATTVQAATIISNGAPDHTGTAYGANMSELLVAEDFTLAGTFDISNIRFWSLQLAAADYRGSAYWAIFDDNAGTPGSILQGNVAATVAAAATGFATGFGYAEYVFNIPVSFQLTAGTYWLALHNGAISDGTAAEMLWSNSATGGGLAGVYTDVPLAAPPIWIEVGQEGAFLLEGSAPTSEVPEPGTVILLAGGLVFGAYLRRKR
ncbi:MAG: PEP-CTERM sorting domain-containing protein [Candidatus Solibacter sp.]|nr:PEP-CTERM sorting domain-containing protein [Candidatus Solibacter sp.]